MKNNFCQFLFFAALIVSCSDSNIIESVNKGNDIITRISATSESKNSRTEIDEYGHLTWSQGDAISIFTVNNETSPAQFITESNSNSAVFTGEIESSSKYWGLYPYDGNSELSSDNSTINTYLKSVQEAVPNSFDPGSFLAVGVSTDPNIEFKNVCGGLRFTLSQSDITKIIFESINPAIGIAGNISISVYANDVPNSSIIDDKDKTNKIELTCAEGFSNDGTFYYISILPVSLTSGFRMSFYRGSVLLNQIEYTNTVDIKRSVFASIKDVDDKSSFDKLRVDLSALETANCYIVNKAGNYKFQAVRGNTSASLYGVSSAEVVWETANTDEEISEGDIIEKASFVDGYIYFSTPDNLKEGNALIAANNADGTILWSWHIWCCQDYDPEMTAQQYEDFQGIYLSDKYMMDRNLGALSDKPGDALANGLMYQWGRKDPFMGGAFNGKQNNEKMYSTNPSGYVDNSKEIYGLNFAVENPNTFICNASGSDWLDKYSNDLWTDIEAPKSMYDPCPPGWRVPSGGEYDDFSANKNPWKISNTDEYGREIFYVDRRRFGACITYIDESQRENDAWYPCNGYLDNFTSSLQAMGESAYYWSSTTNSNFAVYTFRISCNDFSEKYTANSAESGKIRSEGHSVRCIKD